jgi:hypothetical protein
MLPEISRRKATFFQKPIMLTQYTIKDGTLYHRLDGPAIMYDQPCEYSNEWWINGYWVDRKIELWALERNIDLDNLSDMDKAVIALEWGNFNE